MTEQKPTPAEMPRFLVRGQYIKDLSFENPHAPQILIKPEDAPKVDVNVSLKGQKIGEQNYELIMHIAAHASGNNKLLFVAELDYAAVIQLINIPEDRQEQVLFIDCAAALFPFARRIIADITRDGGFHPMMLEPIDFLALYHYNKQQAAAAVSKQQAQA